MSAVTLYGRPGCHLCDQARELLIALGVVELHEVDIETDDALFSRYLERIPVVEIGGEVVSELRPDRDAIASALRGEVRRT
jgi:glutaredoxin